jgi:hypothetical protein
LLSLIIKEVTMPVKLGVNGYAKEMISCKVGVNNTAKNVIKIYAGVDDVSKLVWPVGPTPTTDAFKFFFVYTDAWQNSYVTNLYLPIVIYMAGYSTTSYSFPTSLYAWMPSYGWITNPLGYGIGTSSTPFTNKSYRMYRTELQSNFSLMSSTELNRLVNPSAGDIMYSSGNTDNRPWVQYDLYKMRYQIPQLVAYAPSSRSTSPIEYCESVYLTLPTNGQGGLASATITFKDETLQLTY